MDNDGLLRDGGLDDDPRDRPGSRGGIEGVPAASAIKQDKGARVFAVVAILLFACYFVAAVTVHA